MESDSTAMSGNKIFRFTSEENQHSFKASDKNITVMCSGGAHDRGSSKIKLDNVVNYKWEVKHYPGRLIACHKEGQLLAYALTVVKLQKPEGMVRVASLQLSQRALIRGLSEMLDIQFAHTTHPDYLLGIIERSNLQVYQVLINGTELTTSLKVKIVDPLEGHVPEYDRINWCPYLRENDYEIDDFASQLLVWTRGSTFQCYSISKLSKTYGESVNLKAVDIDEGGFKASDGDATITGSVYSADGTTLALSSMDGMIRFYQVYQHANNCTPRRLHQWKPHGGRSVSSFFFLDNYTETVDNDKVLWKNVITCADNNTEIRVWCCESWECLQTIRLESPMVQPLNFKAEIDLSSSFLVLSDMNTRQIYVLQIRKGQSSSSSALPSPASSSARDQASGEPQWKSRTASLARGKVNRRVDQSSIKPYIVSIAEYPISTMILGFGILWARVGNCFQREQDDEDEDQSLPSCIVIRMFLVQPSSMQDCTLVYDPVDESECEPLAIDAGDDVNTNDCEVEDGNEMQSPQSSGSSVSSSSSAASSSAETTDNNLSHPPSEASDQSVERESKVVLTAMSAPKASAEESSDGSGSNAGSRKDDEEEEGSPGPATNLLMLKMAEAAQKLNDKNKPASGSPPDANTSASGGINSGPTTPASTTAKVNLMTPDSFSTPSGRGSRSEKNKSDETVNPNVLNTLLMLANATKQRQPAQKVVEMVSSSVTLKGTTVSGAPQARPANDMQAFVNMMNSLTLNKEAVMSSGKLPESSNGPLDGAEGGIPPEIPPMPSADMLASGGSSPSREVQEIMSTKGSGLNLMVDDLLHFVYTPGQRKPSALDDEEEEEVEEAGVDVDDGGNAGGGGQGVTTHTVSDSRYAEEEGVVRVASNGPQEEKLEPSDNNEKLGDGEEIGNKILVTSEGATSSTVDIDGLQNASAVPTIDGESKKPTVAPFWPSVPLATTATVSDSSKQTLEALTDKMDRMMELLLAQSCRMEEMNGQLEAMKKAKNDEHRRYSTLINRFQQTIPKTIETQINNCLVQHTVRLEHTIQSCFGKQQALLTEALKNSIVQALLAQLPEQLSVHLVRDLHLKILVPIGGKLDVVQRGLTDEIAHRLATLEDPLKNAITRTLRAEQFHNAIAINVKRDLKQQFDEAYNDSLRNTVIPRYEKVHQELFRQANLCFTEGVKELMRKIDEHIGRVAQTHERTNEVADLLRKIPDEIAVKGERVTSNTLRVIREHLEKDIKGLHTPLMKTIRENIRQEIEKGFEAQASCLEDSVLSVVRSQAQTPAPTGIEVQDQIKKYLKADQINLAFHMALASNELSVVEFLLERADPKKVFDPCPLEQTVLLSLIQQISADMSNHNELKHKYLDDAIVSLNLDDPVTQEHSPKVMQELIANCQTFITANPLNPLCGKLKMLMFAAKYISGEQI
ncbi:enhancer of mRNA-decapping protein 4 homolog isoform X2 [Anopheles ziemanni]|uniref:enhancer of mRNA-decapping protein 4 homolog isoform X2 n=1 Tax=Anopheles coustani TaxID=139045 RepID=UPI0026584A3B|nr:enhancer of mRNA-decapping protein 4 homolog isoform X2 [Anopheles coustani]XP_058168641.1 enhancer of mRNA-decapping protein 4 homolog isoform X2 [Anopheles ziemanni]